MSVWYVGEARYVYTTVSSASSASFTITSATYSIYDCSTTAVVASGDATISSSVIYAKFTPASGVLYSAEFSYVIGQETFKAKQIIDVKGTM